MLASEWNKQVGFYLTDRKVRWGGEEAAFPPGEAGGGGAVTAALLLAAAGLRARRMDA